MVIKKVSMCRWCGSIVHLTCEQCELLNEVISLFEKLSKTGITFNFNFFGAIDAVAKCCDRPDYWHIDVDRCAHCNWLYPLNSLITIDGTHYNDYKWLFYVNIGDKICTECYGK